MKVSDDEILKACRVAQVKRAASGVVSRYIGGTYGLCDAGDSNKQYAMQICSISRKSLGVGLSSSQLLKRLRDLVQQGKLVMSGNEFQGVFHYQVAEGLDCLFQQAWVYWANLGMPSGMEGGRCRSIKMDDFEARLEECKSQLLKEYSLN